MKNRIDIILKLIITAAILITLLFIAVPGLSESKKSSPGMPAGISRGGAPSSAVPGAAPGARPTGARAGAGQASAGQAVKAYTASLGTVSNYIRVNGDMITEVKIDIFPDVRGKLIEHKFSVGDYVQKNSIVAMVDPSLPGQTYAKSAVYSTISGTVLSVNAQVGDTVTTNSSIITVGDLSDLQLQTFVPEKYIGNLKLGFRAEVIFAAYPNEVFTARITELNPVIDPQSRTMEIKLKMSRHDSRIKSGMYGAVKLVTEQAENVLSIPSAAVFTYYGEDTVYVIEEDRVMKRTVELGLSTVEMTEVINGLKPGEVVVTEGQNLLSDGSAVHVID
jgi:membrane fusion protein (multidrug efflux system)